MKEAKSSGGTIWGLALAAILEKRRKGYSLTAKGDYGKEFAEERCDCLALESKRRESEADNLPPSGGVCRRNVARRLLCHRTHLILEANGCEESKVTLIRST